MQQKGYKATNLITDTVGIIEVEKTVSVGSDQNTILEKVTRLADEMRSLRDIVEAQRQRAANNTLFNLASLGVAPPVASLGLGMPGVGGAGSNPSVVAGSPIAKALAKDAAKSEGHSDKRGTMT